MMEIPEGMQKKKDFEARLITRILSDDGFRAEFEQDPKAAIEKEVGTQLPEGVKVNVIHEEPGTITVVIPPKVTEVRVDEELSDEAMEEVAGAGAPVVTPANLIIHVVVG